MKRGGIFMNNQSFSWKRAGVLAGSVIAYYMGSGYATGQEMLQYYAAYGLISMLSCAFYFFFFWYLNQNFIYAGHIGQYEGGMKQICQYFCGKYIGTFYDWFASFFCYLCFIVMCAGGGAVLNQQYGAPVWAGALIIAGAGLVSAVFGLSKLVDVLGRIGPVLILLCLAGAVAGIINGKNGIIEGSQLTQDMEIMKAAPTWWQAIINNVGFAIMWMIGFFGGIGREEPVYKNAKYGTIIGIFTVSVAFAVVTLSELSNIELIWDSQIPLLLIINQISPIAATVYAVVAFLGVYTTACPLLWTGVSRMAKEGTKKYKLITIAAAAAGFFVSVALPFNRLVNIVYVINGYVGFAFVAFVVIRNIRNAAAKSQKKAGQAVGE